MKASNRLHARLMCAASALALTLGTAAHAEVRQFDIPAGSLGDALAAFGMQSDLTVVTTTDITRSKSSKEVAVAAEPETALAQLLGGTGLTFRREGDTFLIVRADGPQGGSAAGGGAEVEALIVTAQKREEDIQDVPIAISAFTQEDLTRSQIAGGPDLMTQVPNMTFTKTNFTSYSIQLRGIGTQAISATTDPAVAVAFNNTPFIRNRFFEQEFYDLQRVEVLRGPQGTLYGRNATAGVVNIISAKPKFAYEAKASADIGNYNSTRLEGMLNLPLVEDKAALRLAGAWTKRDGYVTNLVTGQQTDGRDLWSGRVSLAFEPTDWFRADLIYEHFEEKDDRLRTGKQLCKKSSVPTEIDGVPLPTLTEGNVFSLGPDDFAQGCVAASLYSPDSFQTPNGYALPYYAPTAGLSNPVFPNTDPYANATQSRDLRTIETHLTPVYEATTDLVELQLRFDLPGDLTLQSETAFARDYIFSFSDYNRFDTTPGVFESDLSKHGSQDPQYPVVHEDGTFCDPQLGCTDRLAAGDLATAKSQHFSQEFRLASNFDGPFNFSIGSNFLRYDTEDKYYVFINSLTLFTVAVPEGNSLPRPWIPGVTDNSFMFENWPKKRFRDTEGRISTDPNVLYPVHGFQWYIDPNNIYNLNDNGRNYFLSRNPYGLLSYAAFGEGYLNLADNLKLTGGFRWTVDKKTAPQIPSWLLASESFGTPTRKVIEQEWREPTGRIAIDWKPELGFTDETLIYTSYVHGYKAGGANPPPPVIVYPPVDTNGLYQAGINAAASTTHPETFDAEYVDAFEIGSKNTLLDGRLTLNFGAFYYDYKGYQISQIVNRSAVNLNFDAEIWGLELEADWRPLENLRLAFRGGYENTRMADGSQAVDLMDRTAGQEGWILMKPMPPMPSNCIVPTWLAIQGHETNPSLPAHGGICFAYLAGLDPVTAQPYVPNPDPSTYRTGNWGTDYPGFDPSTAPNNGEGFSKDLSGNELPNAPDFTATITADYTLPLANEWLMTLHTDLYYQSEAWTRIFNMEGYDKLKAYSNINLAAIFANEDAGWNVMAYVKNVLDRDSITGAFLNSDDSGLTTNVFLTEPRLYGLRVTKRWDGGAWFPGLGGDGHQPFRLELGGYYGEFNAGHEIFAPPATELFSSDFPASRLDPQRDIDAGTTGSVKLAYQPTPGGWSIGAAIRYGRATGGAANELLQEVEGGYAKYEGAPPPLGLYYLDPTEENLFNYSLTDASNEEIHTIVDFMVGQEIGLGLLGQGVTSHFDVGLRYARLKSVSQVELHARPDLSFPDYDVLKYGGQNHRVHGDLAAVREFQGGGPAATWEMSWPLAGTIDGVGQFNFDLSLGGSVLWGKQKAIVQGETRGEHVDGVGGAIGALGGDLPELSPSYETPFHYTRSESVTVPSAEASLGLSYTLGGLKVSGGYRWERFFDAIDGGIAEAEQFDRTIDGPYFKIAVGFGG